MGKKHPFLERKSIEEILEEWVQKKTVEEKEIFFQKKIQLNPILQDLTREERVVCSEILFLQQEHIFQGWEENKEHFHSLLRSLICIDRFYEEIGGLIGYHLSVLRLQEESKRDSCFSFSTISPPVVDISFDSLQDRKMICDGIRHLPTIAEFYPVGGAGDRLHLVDPISLEPLPAAKLQFLGKTLLEILIDDVFAKEYLYYKLFGQEVQVPMVLMTSEEKKNHDHIVDILEKKEFFGRPKESILFCMQPLVPTITEDGRWYVQEPLHLLLKPGGHGVIWKAARLEKIFEKLRNLDKKKAIVRQINNPLSGIDYGLFALCGYGSELDMSFGFVACPGEKDTAEGIIVLLEKEGSKGSYVFTNIEYCDFQKYGIAHSSENNFANTNILFIDLMEVESASKQMPFPGMLINTKEVHFSDSKGEFSVAKVARLESVMQNISEAFIEGHANGKKVFVMSNRRDKTISTIKKSFHKEKSIVETPHKCFYDLLCANRILLEKHCRMKIPTCLGLEEYMDTHPPFFFHYHPALGPLFSIISQKIRGGIMFNGGEMRLDIAEIFLENMSVQGSFLVKADNVSGALDDQKIRHPSLEVGRCFCKNVTIVNEGIDWELSSSFWSGDVKRKGSCQIFIEGNGEFFAEDVVLDGNLLFVVKNNEILRLEKKGSGYVEKRLIKSHSHPTWNWKYRVTEDQRIALDLELL
ncbi:MAG: UTP--glucose-1-phosphate uridylyltransferase [Chlamydiota bacterium]